MWLRDSFRIFAKSAMVCSFMVVLLIGWGNCLRQPLNGVAAGLVGAVAVDVDRGGDGLVPEDVFHGVYRRSVAE